MQQTCLILNLKAERLLNYCYTQRLFCFRVVGVDDNRRLVVKLLQENDYDLIVCERKDRLSRVGFNYLGSESRKCGNDKMNIAPLLWK